MKFEHFHPKNSHAERWSSDCDSAQPLIPPNGKKTSDVTEDSKEKEERESAHQQENFCVLSPQSAPHDGGGVDELLWLQQPSSVK